MSKVIDYESFSLDAGELYRAGAAGADGWGTDWEQLGPTMENNAFRVRQTKYRPTLNNVMGPVKGTERILEEIAELECTLPELTAANYARAVPGSISSVASIAETAAGWTAALDGAVLAGAETIELDDATGVDVGDYFRIEAVGPTAEYRQIVELAGTTATLDRPLIRGHANAAVLTQTDGDGRTTITGSGKRLPDEAYGIYRLDIETPEGLHQYFIKDAINIADTTELVGQREGQTAPRVTLQARYDPANTRLRPWKIVTP